MWTAISAIVAVYAAGLSTWLAIERILAGNPIFILQPPSERSEGGRLFTLRIRNAGKYPILIERLSPRRPSPDKVAIFEARLRGVDLRHVINNAITQELDLFVPADDEAQIDLLIDDETADLDMVIAWQKHGMRAFSRKTRLRRTNSQLNRLAVNVLES
jgi:hypothetical protein